MKLEALYRKAVAVGIERDPRGSDEVRRLLADEEAKFAKLSGDEAKAFDLDRLFNPYADTRMLSGGPEVEVHRAIAGIDMEVAEVLLTHTLNRDKAKGIDLIIAHHPEGRALARLHDVMRLQADLLAVYGVNVSVAEQLMDKRIGEVERRLLPVNHTRTVDAARILGLPMVCIHTPADNCVVTHLRDLFGREQPARLKSLVDLLGKIPEYARAARIGAGPKIVSGSENGRCGKIFVDMTGGTEGSKAIFEQHAIAGVSTIVSMHLSEDALECAKKANLNVVVAGHISSDTLGFNLLLDALDKEEALDVIGVSGFERIRGRER